MKQLIQIHLLTGFILCIAFSAFSMKPIPYKASCYTYHGAMGRSKGYIVRIQLRPTQKEYKTIKTDSVIIGGRKINFKQVRSNGIIHIEYSNLQVAQNPASTSENEKKVNLETKITPSVSRDLQPCFIYYHDRNKLHSVTIKDFQIIQQ